MKRGPHHKLTRCAVCLKSTGKYRYKFCSDKCQRIFNAKKPVVVRKKIERPRFYQDLLCINPQCENRVPAERRTYCSDTCAKTTRRTVFDAEMHLPPL